MNCLPECGQNAQHTPEPSAKTTRPLRPGIGRKFCPSCWPARDASVAVHDKRYGACRVSLGEPLNKQNRKGGEDDLELPRS